MRDYPIKSGMTEGVLGNDGTPFCHPQLDWGSALTKKVKTINKLQTKAPTS